MFRRSLTETVVATRGRGLHEVTTQVARSVGAPRFIHIAEGGDDMAAHIRTSFTSVTFSIPIGDGALALGTWQGIHVWEHRIRPHRRRLAVHIAGA